MLVIETCLFLISLQRNQQVILNKVLVKSGDGENEPIVAAPGTGCFVMINKSNGQVITAIRNNLVLMRYTADKSDQMWFWYRKKIVSYMNGKCIEASNIKGNPPKLSFCSSEQTERQMWEVKHASSIYNNHIVSPSKTLFLDVMNNLPYGSTLGLFTVRKKKELSSQWMFEQVTCFSDDSYQQALPIRHQAADVGTTTASSSDSDPRLLTPNPGQFLYSFRNGFNDGALSVLNDKIVTADFEDDNDSQIW